MNKKSDRIRLICYIATLLLILAYPAYRIKSFEFPSGKPARFKFEVTLYDPYDPFRGRYVRLNCEGRCETGRIVGDAWMREAWVLLERDGDGMARAVEIAESREELAGRGECIRVKDVRRVMPGESYWDRASGDMVKAEAAVYTFRYPFEKYFANEKVAPELEKSMRESVSGGGRTLLTADVYPDGSWVLRDLTILSGEGEK